MRRLTLLAAPALLASLLTFGLGARPTHAATTSWVSTGTGAEAASLVKATLVGALPAATPLQISVALQPQNWSNVQNAIKAETTSRQFLTPQQFAAEYGAPTGSVEAVKSYLASQGFSNIQVQPNNLLITAQATAGQAESAFNTAINQYTQNGLTIYANLNAPQVPSSLNGMVSAVLGLTNAGKMAVPPTPTVPNATSYLQSYNPQDFRNIYDLTWGLPPANNTAIAIFAEGNLNGTLTDLRTEETANNLPQVPVTVVPTGIQSGDTSGADEWNMDTQYSTGIAGAVKQLYVYDATSLTDSDLAISFSKFASDNLAKAGSASFGECEYQAYLDGSMVADDMFFAEAALQGQTVFASAGDTGGFCPVAANNGVPAGVPLPNYPASSPYVVSVGGTSLFTNGTPSQNGGPSGVSYNDEIAWTAGGGGPSAFEYQPYWQSGVTPATSTTCVQVVACLGRNVPDIAMDADPNSGANVYIGGTPTAVGGTSLASPLALGTWATLASAANNFLGFASPLLYRLSGTQAFHDIVLGDTGPYPATPGWDYATGLGSIDGNMMYAPLIAAQNPQPPAPATLASPACTTASDPSGDAHPTGSTGNVDSLDIRAIGFVADGSNVRVEMKVQSLNDGPGGLPALAGAGDVWYVTWNYNGTEYFLSAEWPGASADPSNPLVAVAYSYGTVTKSPTGGTLYNNVGNAAGSFDLTNGIITLETPASTVGSPASGAGLSGSGGATFESVGTPAGGLLEAADNAGPGSNYTLGTSC